MGDGLLVCEMVGLYRAAKDSGRSFWTLSSSRNGSTSVKIWGTKKRCWIAEKSLKLVVKIVSSIPSFPRILIAGMSPSVQASRAFSSL